MLFCITFGQSHPLRDNWIEIEAKDRHSAREAAFLIFKGNWSNIYPKGDFGAEYYPLGKAGKTIVADNN